MLLKRVKEVRVKRRLPSPNFSRWLRPVRDHRPNTFTLQVRNRYEKVVLTDYIARACLIHFPVKPANNGRHCKIKLGVSETFHPKESAVGKLGNEAGEVEENLLDTETLPRPLSESNEVPIQPPAIPLRLEPPLRPEDGWFGEDVGMHEDEIRSLGHRSLLKPKLVIVEAIQGTGKPTPAGMT